MHISLPSGGVTELSFTSHNGSRGNPVQIDGKDYQKYPYINWGFAFDNVQKEIHIPDYFEQHPYGEDSVQIANDRFLNPVLHAKVRGSLTYNRVTYEPSGSGLKWDPIGDRLCAKFIRRITFGMTDTGSISYTDRSHPPGSSNRKDKVTCYWKVKSYPIGAGKFLLVHRFFWIRHQITGSSTSAEVAWTGYPHMWVVCPSDRTMAGVTTWKDIQGTTWPSTKSWVFGVEIAGGKTMKPASVASFVAEQTAAMNTWLDEELPVGTYSATTRRQKWVDYPDLPNIVDVEQKLRGYTALEAMQGEEYRYFYSPNDLCYRALQGLPDFEGNGLLLGKELATIGLSALDTARSMTKLLSSMRSCSAKIIQSKIRTAAGLWLQKHWGYDLTVRDTIDILQHKLSAEPKRLSSETSGTDNGDWIARYHIYYCDDLELQLLAQKLAMQYDFELDASNLWDMVPYSFVVDWFYDLGSFLQAADNYFTVARKYKVLGVVESFRKTRKSHTINMQDFPASLTGNVEFTYYRRKVYKEPVVPTPPSDVTINPSRLHVVEGAALVLANIS